MRLSILLSVCTLLTLSTALQAAQLTGWIEEQPPSVNLTSEGTRDWIQAGYNGDQNKLNRKLGANLLSALTISNPTPANRGALVGNFSWSDGSPDASCTGTSAGAHATTAIRFSVPADTAVQTLRVYFSCDHVAVKVYAHLSDVSAPDFVDERWYAMSGTIAPVATLSFAAASAGQQLTVTLIHNSGNNSPALGLHAVTLRAGSAIVPPPPPPPAPSGLHVIAGNGRVALNWDQMPRVDSYRIYRASSATRPAAAWKTGILPITGNFDIQLLDAVDSTATNGTTWHYWVSSLGASGETISASDAVATPADPGTTRVTTGRDLSILPLGDSITNGYPVNGGYRLRLLEKLAAGGYLVHMAGSGKNNSEGMADPYHEGWPGWGIQPIMDRMDRILGVYQPDIILLMIGTNHLVGSGKTQADIDQTLALYDGLLAKIFQVSPNTHVIVSPILPMQGNTLPPLFNAALQTKVAALAVQGRQISWCSQMAGIRVDQLADGIHPNAQGYTAMGDHWHEAIQAITATAALPGPGAVRNQFGRSGADLSDPACDLNSDGRVDAADLSLAVRTQGQ